MLACRSSRSSTASRRMRFRSSRRSRSIWGRPLVTRAKRSARYRRRSVASLKPWKSTASRCRKTRSRTAVCSQKRSGRTLPAWTRSVRPASATGSSWLRVPSLRTRLQSGRSRHKARLIGWRGRLMRRVLMASRPIWSSRKASRPAMPRWQRPSRNSPGGIRQPLAHCRLSDSSILSPARSLLALLRLRSRHHLPRRRAA